MNWLESIIQNLSSVISRSPDSDVKSEVKSEINNAEEFLETAEKFEANIDSESFLKQRAKGSREKAEEIIEDKIKESITHIIKAEKTAEQLDKGKNSDLRKLEQLTERAEKLAESIDSNLEVKRRKEGYGK